MVRKKGWPAVGLIGVLVLCTASGAQIPFTEVKAQVQSGDLAFECTEQRGQILSLLVRDLGYRSSDYVNAGQFSLAARTLGRTASMVGVVADPFAKTDIVATLAGVSGGQPSALEQIVRHSLATQQPELALSVLPQIADATQTLQGEYGVINVKRSILVQLADYYLELGQPQQARSQLDQARSLLDSLRGDGFGLIAAPVAEGYAALGDNQTAIAILDEAGQQTERMTHPDRDYIASIWSAIATAYAKAGANQQALQIAETIAAPGVKAVTLVKIAEEIASTTPSEPSDQVDRLLSQVRALVEALPQAERAQIGSTMVVAHAKAGQWQTALAGVDGIASPEAKLQTLVDLTAVDTLQPEIKTRLLNTLVQTAQIIEPFYDGDAQLSKAAAQLLANQQYEPAFQLAQKLDATLRTNVLLSLIESASAAGNFAIAQQALAALEPGWEDQTRSLGLRAMALGHLQAGQVDEAIQQLALIKDTPHYPSRASTQIAIAQFYVENEQPEQAQEYLNQALKSLADLEATPAQLELLGQIVVQFAQLGKQEQAKAAQLQALKIAQPLNFYYGVEPLLRQYLQAENYTLALELAQALESSDSRDRTLQSVVRQLLETGDVSAAAQTAATVQDPQQRVAVLVQVADYYRALGQTSAAVDTLAQSFAVAQALPGPDEIRYAATPREPSVPARDPLDRGSLLESITIRYAELDQLDATQKVVQALRSPADQTRLRQKLTCYATAHPAS